MSSIDSTATKAPEVECRMSVETPEQIQFTFDLAGIGTRMPAYLIDVSIRLALQIVLLFLVILPLGIAAPGASIGLYLVLLFAIEWAYHTLFEWLANGYTPGKRALGIRVVRTDGVPVDLVRSAMRNLLRVADGFPVSFPLVAFLMPDMAWGQLFLYYLSGSYAVGMATMIVTSSDRRLGDYAADTMVIRDKHVRLRELPTLPEDKAFVPVGMNGLLSLSEKDLSFIDEFFSTSPVLFQ